MTRAACHHRGQGRDKQAYPQLAELASGTSGSLAATATSSTSTSPRSSMPLASHRHAPAQSARPERPEPTAPEKERITMQPPAQPATQNPAICARRPIRQQVPHLRRAVLGIPSVTLLARCVISPASSGGTHSRRYGAPRLGGGQCSQGRTERGGLRCPATANPSSTGSTESAGRMWRNSLTVRDHHRRVAQAGSWPTAAPGLPWWWSGWASRLPAVQAPMSACGA